MRLDLRNRREQRRSQGGDRPKDVRHLVAGIFVGDQVSQLSNAYQLAGLLEQTAFFGTLNAVQHAVPRRQLQVVDQPQDALHKQVGEPRKTTGQGLQTLELLE